MQVLLGSIKKAKLKKSENTSILLKRALKFCHIVAAITGYLLDFVVWFFKFSFLFPKLHKYVVHLLLFLTPAFSSLTCPEWILSVTNNTVWSFPCFYVKQYNRMFSQFVYKAFYFDLMNMKKKSMLALLKLDIFYCSWGFFTTSGWDTILNSQFRAPLL